MVSGVSPFYDDDRQVTIRNIRTIKIEYPGDIFPHISEGCLTLLKVMFIRSPRYVCKFKPITFLPAALSSLTCHLTGCALWLAGACSVVG